MRQVVFDIETVSFPFETLSESQQEYLLRDAQKLEDQKERDKKIDDSIRFMSLYPFTAKVIAIGLYDVQKEKAFIYYQSEDKEEWYNEEKDFSYRGLNEAEMLKSFWRIAEKTDQFISFNGRNFDIPFLMMRSALNKIKPSKNLMTNRYDTSLHIDLLEQFTYYGVTRKFNLDFYCHAFGIESPKSKDISGMEVKTLYEAGRVKDIAVYCGGDIEATHKLFKIWDEYLKL
jgi:3'-5' exonuclease